MIQPAIKAGPTRLTARKRGWETLARRATGFAALGLLVGTLSTTVKPAMAQASAASQNTSNYTLTPFMFKKMNEINELMEAQKYDETVLLLEKLAERKRSTRHEQALIHQFFGFVYSAKSQYARAAASFEKSLATGALPDATLLSMRYNLAQLYMAEEEYAKALGHLNRWMTEMEAPSAHVYYLVGAAHAQLAQTKKALPFIQKAVELSDTFVESWWQLLVALHFDQKQYGDAANALVQLIDHHPKKSYLQQLQGIYSELGEEKKALAVMELSYRQGYLASDAELRNLARLYLYHGIPDFAARVMQTGMASSAIEADAEAWELLGDSLLYAKDYEGALTPLRNAAEKADDGNDYLKLARFYIDNESWSDAEAALDAALAKGNLEHPEDAHLMLGIARANTGSFEKARRAFEMAAKSAKSRSSAQRWLKHLADLERQAAAS